MTNLQIMQSDFNLKLAGDFALGRI